MYKPTMIRIVFVRAPLWALFFFFSMSMAGCQPSASSPVSFSVDGASVGYVVSAVGGILASTENDLAPIAKEARGTLETQVANARYLQKSVELGKNELAFGYQFVLESPTAAKDRWLHLKISTNAPVLFCDVFEAASGKAHRMVLYPPIAVRGSLSTTYDLPLRNISTLAGFRLVARDPQAKVGIIAVAVDQQSFGLLTDPNNFHVPASAQFIESETGIELIFSATPRHSVSQVIQVSYETAFSGIDSSIGGIELILRGEKNPETEKKIWNLRLRRGQNSVYLYEDSLDFKPVNIRIDRLHPGARITKISRQDVDQRSGLKAISGSRGLRTWNEQDFVAPNPLPADLLTLLKYPQKSWRQDFMEVFSWNLYPTMLVVDFANLDVQDRFLKRLIYFTEKKGFRGTLQTNSVIEPLHGWNANDFRAESMASFFSEAERTDFLLNAEEKLLRNCLVQWGILKKNPSGGYQAVGGGLLTVARGNGMSAVNRSLLLQHESLHGVFFSRPDFQAAVEAEMARMNPEARNFMISYFSFYQYDPDDQYLMSNEFQAYLLQQPLANLTAFITQNMVANFGRYNPREKRDFRLAAYRLSTHIYDSASRLSEELFKETGLINGQMACLVER